MDLVGFARILAPAGRADTAVRVLSLAEALREERGISHPAWMNAVKNEAESMVRNRLDEAAFADAYEQGRKLTADEAVALALGSLGEHAAGARPTP